MKNNIASWNYETSVSTPPTLIFPLLLGSQQAVDSSATLKTLSEKVIKDFRATIERNLPVFYVLDAEEIVDGVLEDLLNPQINTKSSRGLSKYLSGLECNDFDFVVTYGPDPNFDEDYYTESRKDGSVKYGIDSIYIKAYNYIVGNRSALISDVHKAILSNSKNTVSIKNLSKDLHEAIAYVNASIADLVGAGAETSKIASTSSMVTATAVGKTMREVFKKYPKSRISDPESLISGFNSSTMVLAVAANYELAVTSNHNAATEAILKHLKRIPVSNVELEDVDGNPVQKSITVEIHPTDQFKVGNVVAAGHAAVKSSNKGMIGINTPLYQIAMAILQAAGASVPGIAQAFINESGHAPYAIDITTDYSDLAGNLIALQTSFLRSQRTKINSGIISGAEVKFFDAVFEQALNKSRKDLFNQFLKDAKNPETLKFLSEKYARSPTLKQSIKNKITSVIVGDLSYKGKASSASSKAPTQKSNTKTPSIKLNSASKSTPLNNRTPAKKVAESKVTRAIQFSLASLQSLLNNNLVQQIKRNMGDGSRRDILNLRSGRFAESVKVERMSQSREGMITAFYTYMKNPYATFSQGGDQEFPRTRDPKLLISKSIREIATQQVANRLRAVSI